MKNKLWLLLKVQLRSTLGRRPDSKKKSVRPALGSLGRSGSPLSQKNAPAASGSGNAGYTVLMVFVAIMMVFLVVFFSMTMADSLAPLGLIDLLPALMMAASCVTVLITTIYKTNGILFGFRDYDLVMSLPVKTSTVIASRVMILYLYNMLFCLVILVPSTIVYAMYATPPAGFYPVFVICLLLVPLVPVIIATAIGMLIAWIASHFKRKSGANIIFTVIALLLWMYLCMNMSNIAVNFANIGETLMQVISRVYPLVTWYTAAVCTLDMASFALFAAVSVGAFLLFTAVIAKNFKHINNSLTADRTSSDFQMSSLKQSSKKAALFGREWRRFISTPVYVLNSGIGVILILIFAVLILVAGAGTVLNLIGMSGFGNTLTDILPVGLSFFIVMTCPSAASVSLEGKSFWIIKTMPVQTKDVLMAKLKVNLYLTIFAVLISSTLINIALQPTPLQAVMMYATPLAYSVFTSLFGLRLNLSNYNFDWNTEMQVVKQSMPVMTVILTGMAITIVPAILVLTLGPMVSYIVTAALAVLCVLLYSNIFTKGIRDFDAIGA